MVGRYSNREIYRELFLSKDFLRFLFGGALIPAAFAAGYLLQDYRFFGLLTPAQLLFILAAAINGAPIIAGAVQGILSKRINVDELVSAALAACLVSGEYLEAAVVSAIMVLGSLIEEGASEQARNSIRALVDLSPKTATVEDADGGEREVGLESVKIGDALILRPGDTVPVDGIIYEGVSSFDEASLTGESLPVTRRSGDEIQSGTRNLDGFVKFRASRTSSDSTLSRIIALVQSAENSKVRGTRLVDSYAVFFTPVVLGLAALTLIITKDFNRAVTVLIVGCPCSFLLSGPVPTVAAVARAAREGILVKDGVALETLARSSHWFFDKTGTLTEGRPRLEKIDLLAPQEPALSETLTADALLVFAAAVETGSEHPLGRAIVEAARSRALTLPKAEQITVKPGEGITGLVEGRTVHVGRINERPHGANPPVPDKSPYPATIVAVTIDGAEAGTLSFRDSPRPESASAIASLRRQGIGYLAVISGDQEGPVRSVAAELQLDSAHHRLTPQEKLEHLRLTRAQLAPSSAERQSPSRAHLAPSSAGRQTSTRAAAAESASRANLAEPESGAKPFAPSGIASRPASSLVYVGDGLNDAPALQIADVGIAMGERGVDAALETADIVLLNDRIGSLPFLHRLARRMRGTIKTNIILSFSINALSIAAAFAGLLTPVLGAVSHNIGSVLVVTLSASIGLMKEK